MNEKLLHYLWRNKIFSNLNLNTTDGRSLTLIDTGIPHQDAGPDFKQAVIRIDDITWVGDVEIHVRASDWLRHGHQHNPKYQTIILHVVYENDVNLHLPFPTLELQNVISHALIEEYQQMSCRTELLPCRSDIASIPRLQLTSWMSRLAVERNERRQREIVELLKRRQGNWEEAAFHCFVMNFGFRTNSAAFESLAIRMPYKCVLKHKDSRLQIYALTFGIAGFLDDSDVPDDDYFKMLQSEYHYLRYKYHLQSVDLKIWKLLRLRPQNFPCIRLAQLSECLYRVPDLVEQILYGEDVAPLVKRIPEFEPHSYWKTHWSFGKVTKEHPCCVGRNTVNLLIINTIVPVRMAYAHFFGDVGKQEQALSLLEKVEFERNSITAQYADAGFPTDNALCSQALLELYKNYCTVKGCFQCEIGCAILKKAGEAGH